MVKIYNSLRRELQDFKPLKPGYVSMYVCGPTVYNFLHIGNFRGPVFFNLVRNYLERLGYQVEFALNFTDVDDKIIQRANELGEDPQAFAEKYIFEYKKDYASLGLRPHTFNPKVTESMTDIVSMVEKLIVNKKAYVAEGDVMFSIQSFPEYGKLSGRVTEDLQAGARVDVDEKKQNPFDFALWKSAKIGEVSWPSPWGPGRPGWHIECSAMIQKLFGSQIDIHGGGSDLMFPHHENEIAQSEGCSGHQFVQYWMHNAMLNTGGQKMSKSLGNFLTMRDFLQQHDAETYKWMILSVHYRHVADFSDDAIARAQQSLAKFYSALATAETILGVNYENGIEKINCLSESLPKDGAWEKIIQESWQKIESGLNDDFSTPQVVAQLFELVRLFNSQVKRGIKVTPVVQRKAFEFRKIFKEVGQIMALFQEPAQDFLIKLDDRLLAEKKLNRSEINQLVTNRWQARLAKDFKKSDELRDQLLSLGISVMDSADGSFWEVTK